jgi:DNA helicase-2/ATP-dependent DNA helicase PcrA
VLPFAARGDAIDLPVLKDYDRDSLEAFEAECKADDRDEERRLAYVAFTRPRRLLLASGYCWTRSRVNPCAPSTYLTELRELGSPAVTVDGWCDDPSDADGNPLSAAAVADVAWPQPPRADAFARRRGAADLVLAAIEGSAAGQEAFDLRAEGGLSWADEAELVIAELRAERVGSREVPLPRRLTASQVVALAEDPDRLAQMLARPMPVRPQPQARRGSRFHKWVEDLYGAVPLLEPDDLPGAGDADVSDDELADLQQRFLADGWGDRRPVAVEQPFELVLGGRLVRGRIDAVYPRDGGGFDVIDYKTGAVPKDFAAASLQLSVYRLAWADLRAVDPAEVDAGFLYVRTGTVKRPERLLSREELTQLLGG